MAGMESCPTGRPLVKSSVEAAKRKVVRPVQPKSLCSQIESKQLLMLEGPGLGLFKGLDPGI